MEPSSSTNHNYTCEICCNENLETNDVYKCHCKSVYCKNCIRKQSLQSVVEPKCMNPDCNSIYTLDQLKEIFDTKKSSDDLEKHIKDYLYIKESKYFDKYTNDNNKYKRILDIYMIGKYIYEMFSIIQSNITPDVQKTDDTFDYEKFGINILANKIKCIKEIYENVLKLEVIDKQKILNILSDSLDKTEWNVSPNDLYTFICNICEKENKFLNIVNKYYFIANDVNEFYEKNLYVSNDHLKKLNLKCKDVSVLKCHNKGCESFIDHNLYCEKCENYTCQKCYEPTKSLSEHECDEETLKTIKEIKMNSKQCPNCNMSINKSHGCNDMFCTNCHIFFCYRTGKKLDGIRHNPEYFEWKKKMKNSNYGGVGDISTNTRESICKKLSIQSSDVQLNQNKIYNWKFNSSTKINELIIKIVSITYSIGHISSYFDDEKRRLKLERGKKSLTYINNHLSKQQFKTFLYDNYKQDIEIEYCKIILNDFTIKTLTLLSSHIDSMITDRKNLAYIEIDKDLSNILNNTNLRFKSLELDIKPYQISQDFSKKNMKDHKIYSISK